MVYEHSNRAEVALALRGKHQAHRHSLGFVGSQEWNQRTPRDMFLHVIREWSNDAQAAHGSIGRCARTVRREAASNSDGFDAAA